MPRAPKHLSQRDDWRQYAEEAAPPRSAASLKDVVKCCNRTAWNKTHHAQTSSEYMEEEYEEASFMTLPRSTRFFRHAVAALLLLPLALITAMSLCDQIAHASGSLHILFSIPVWYFLIGAAFWIIMGCSSLFTSSLLYLYVLGHELTHALAVICSLGSIRKFEATLDGGFIQTNKSNLFISLSPYFLPLWALLWGLIWGTVHIFWPTVVCEAFLYSGLGFWWSFHLFWTAWIIPKDQPDLADNGTFFSLILVYFANLLVFLGLLRLFGAVSITRFGADCWENATRLWETARDLIHFTSGLFM